VGDVSELKARRVFVVNRFKVIKGEIFKAPPLSNLQWPAILGAMGLGFCLTRDPSNP